MSRGPTTGAPDLRRRLLKPVADRLVRPLAERYLRQTRVARVAGLSLEVPSGVFHPGLFFTSGAAARWLAEQPLAGTRLLDLGTGSGVLALVAARAGADVVAVDRSPRALSCARANAERNGLALTAVQSDVLAGVGGDPAGGFDWIVSNPPWFPRDARDEGDLAWASGPGQAFFDRLFGDLASHLRPGARVALALGDSADLDGIREVATRHGWRLSLAHEERVWWEWQRVFWVVPAAAPAGEIRARP